MLKRSLREAWNAERVPSAPVRVWRDHLVVGLLFVGAVLETILRDGAGWRPGAAIAAIALAAAVYLRRTHPLLAMTMAFGTVAALDVVSILVVDEPMEFYTAAIVLVIPYALFRWGSGKEAVVGFALMLGVWAFNLIVAWTDLSDAIGGLIVLTLPAAIGDIVRYQDNARRQGLVQTKLQEREMLARELHDTVAHHVSAIAIQAQAGRAVAAHDPEAALTALVTIEEEASRTLHEMRTMVSALRAGEEAELAPQAAFHDIERIAAGSSTVPVTVERSGDLDGVSPTVDRALFRLAQESITNASRHARNATAVNVTLIGDVDSVRLSVVDDGERRAFDPDATTGFGLVGMTERAALLGGTLQAGPQEHRGWAVEAVLPKISAVST